MLLRLWKKQLLVMKKMFLWKKQLLVMKMLVWKMLVNKLLLELRLGKHHKGP